MVSNLSSRPGKPEELELSPEQIRAVYDEHIKACWNRGVLGYKCHSAQIQLYNHYHNHLDARRMFYLCHRRFGKTVVLLILGLEVCLRKKNARVLFLAPHQKDARTIASDTLSMLLDDCPPELRPTFRTMDMTWLFPNGSQIRIRGVNEESAETLRGGSADLVLLDECGSMDDLKTVVNSVVSPMLLTTNGRAVFATTPPYSPEHEAVKIYRQCLERGWTVKYELPECPDSHIPRLQKIEALCDIGEKREDAADILDRKKPPLTTDARREYFCEFVTDEASAVLPEYQDARHEIFREHPAPEFSYKYIALDYGSVDQTFILYAYHDFLNDIIVVVDEDVIQGPTTDLIAATVKDKEKGLWGELAAPRRVCDADLRLIADMGALYEMQWGPVQKGDVHAATNYVRHLINTRKLRIHPRCTNLDMQCQAAIWNKKRNDMIRASGHHFDGVAALRYLCRAVLPERNPFPRHYSLPGGLHGPANDSWEARQYYTQQKQVQANPLMPKNSFTAKLMRPKKTKKGWW